MDKFTLMFWLGVFTLLYSIITLFKINPEKSKIFLIGFTLMFVGSKIGRKFLGIDT